METSLNACKALILQRKMVLESSADLNSKIRQWAQEVAQREGCLVYDLEFLSGPQRILRVFIDRESGGVSIEDCANVSKGLNLRLDVEDAIPGGRYDLEVSSPGLERKLKEPWHYEKVVGKTVDLKLCNHPDGLKHYHGQLLAVELVAGDLEKSVLQLENKKGPQTLTLSQVERGRVVIGDPLQRQPAPGKKKR